MFEEKLFSKRAEAEGSAATRRRIHAPTRCPGPGYRPPPRQGRPSREPWFPWAAGPGGKGGSRPRTASEHPKQGTRFRLHPWPDRPQSRGLRQSGPRAPGPRTGHIRLPKGWPPTPPPGGRGLCPVASAARQEGDIRSAPLRLRSCAQSISAAILYRKHLK